jgi:hypothetical protein
MALLVPSASASTHPTGAVTLSATIDGHSLAASSASHPIKLNPNSPAVVDVKVENRTAHTVTVQTVDLEGRVAELTFFQFDTSVDLVAHPGQTSKLVFRLDLGGLGGQATGLFPSALTLLSPTRSKVASQSLVVDVRGSLGSVYGLFGIVLLVLTALAFASSLVALARRRLSPNRWLRATRMLTPGIGLGLVFVFALSAFRVLLPSNAHGVEAIVAFGAVFFVLGYLTPAPESEDIDDLDDDASNEDESTIQTEPATGTVAST